MVTLEFARDKSLSVSAEGITRVREKLITADSIEEVIEKKLIPQHGSRHPENTLFRLTDGTLEQVGNTDSKLQFLFTGTYFAEGDGISSADPWELDAQEFSKDHFTISSPVFNLRNKQGQLVPFLNSAHCRMQAQKDLYGTVYNFSFCEEYKTTSEPTLPEQPIVNSETVTVAGESLPAYSSLLFPPQQRLIVDRDDNGEIIRSYWEISCTIHRHPLSGGWFEDYPDVGTLALDSSGRPAPIYRFFPWESAADKNDVNFPPSFGSIQEVVAAKTAYAVAIAGSLSTSNRDSYWSAFQELPYEEFTEPLPLDNGKVYTEAMKNPAEYPYHKITGTVFQVGSFSQFNLPREREGK